MLVQEYIFDQSSKIIMKLNFLKKTFVKKHRCGHANISFENRSQAFFTRSPKISKYYMLFCLSNQISDEEFWSVRLEMMTLVRRTDKTCKMHLAYMYFECLRCESLFKMLR